MLRKGIEVKYAFIERHRRVWPIWVQCRVLGLSAAGYRGHFVRRANGDRRRHLSDDAPLMHIKAIHAERRGGYGSMAGPAAEQPTTGWLYLAVVIDLFSRQVVGWSLRQDMRTAIVIDALRMAWFKRETLLGSLKTKRLHGQRFESRRQAMNAVIAWLL